MSKVGGETGLIKGVIRVAWDEFDKPESKSSCKTLWEFLPASNW